MSDLQMDWLLKFLVIWFSTDVVVIATGWYAHTIRVQFPNWWGEVICGDGFESVRA